MSLDEQINRDFEVIAFSHKTKVVLLKTYLFRNQNLYDLPARVKEIHWSLHVFV